MEGERRATVTVLFTDQVGSTEFLSSVGDRRADRIRRSQFELERRVAAEYGGDVVKSTGDGSMVVFDSVVAALEAATRIQEERHRAARRDSMGLLEVRVGISVGEATQHIDDWYGTPVVEAARLCDAARPGQVLVSSSVVALAGSRQPDPTLPALFPNSSGSSKRPSRKEPVIPKGCDGGYSRRSPGS